MNQLTLINTNGKSFRLAIMIKSLLLFVAVLAVCTMALADERPAKANVVLILTDDLGWQDVRCYDVDDPCAYDTPYLDAFAKKGLMFWQGYSPAPSCSPSRCAIISGVHPARAQKTHVVGGHPPVARNVRAPMIDPWYSGRMPEDTYTLARALKDHGYTTGHAGKWHIAIDHSAFPQPGDVGFDFTRSNRGMHRGMSDRLTGFATSDPKDPYRLDENGFPYHQNNQDALDFIDMSKAEPFFLYYCTWLVHAPIVTRNEALLKKYADRMGVELTQKDDRSMRGQKNPFYGAMVESLDYYMGQIFHYLDTTEDPRWPGHMLSENTYVIFTSDNGGVVGYTDNAPLDKGKTSAKEGGTRVPLLIAGPGVPAGEQTDVMVNGLDFYPTILSLTGCDRPVDKTLDGCDLAPLLLGEPSDASLVKHADDSVRDSLMWHFPHSAYESTLISSDGFKLIRNYNQVGESARPPLELFRLYQVGAEGSERVDIEEVNNIAADHPEVVQRMDKALTEQLEEMQASYPHVNPAFKGVKIPHQDQAPSITEVREAKGKVIVSYQNNGSEVPQAHLIYTKNGGEKYEEWFRLIMNKNANGRFAIRIPEGTTDYFVCLIDENQFLVSHPSLEGYRRGQTLFTDFSIKVKQ